MLTRQGPARRALAAVLATAVLAAPVALVAPAAMASPRAEEPPPNERAPRVPDAPDLGDAPWTSSVAKDVRGYRLSAYTGKYYDPRFEQYRLCVVQRESGGGGYANYRTVSSSFHGAYQFGTGWNSASSLVDRLRPEMAKAYGASAVQQLNQLSSVPVSEWNRFWQDAAFWTVFNRGQGAGQWAGGAWSCDPRPNAEKGWPGNPRGWYGKGPLEGPTSPSASAGSTVTKPTARATPEQNLRLARAYIRDRYGWKYPEFRALKALWNKESNWRHDVINNHPNGPWYGLGQVNGGFIGSRGYSIQEYMRSPLAQIKVGTAYIKERYGSPTKAWAAWMSRYSQNGAGWY